MALTILDGANFCISADTGDIGEGSEGFYTCDTRFLSQLALTVNGEPPLPLSRGRVEYFSAAFYVRNPVAGGLEPDELSIARERFVGEGMEDRITVRSHSRRTLVFDLAIEVGADFADILTVKDHDFTLGNPGQAPPLPDPVEAVDDDERGGFILRGQDGFKGLTQVFFTLPGRIDGPRASYRVELEPGGECVLGIEVVANVDGRATRPQKAQYRFGQERARVEASLRTWRMHVPELSCEWRDLEQSFSRSVADLASLRMGHRRELVGQLPAAGMPWFMTVFGRDTEIACLQTLVFGPELARSALVTLAELQAHEDDPSRDAEPGKIIHELRAGKAADNWFARYYGTVDATPLYLVLLSEVWRWTGDDGLVRELREPALAALEWIDRYGDLDGDGFVEYRRRAERGLHNQSWKDSDDSQLFRDGRRAESPIAPCEVQGYVYDAKLRLAELAREVWADDELAGRLEQEAVELATRFDAAFWCEERGGYYALALDGEKRRVDALTSNIGHLLWSGIVPRERLDAVVGKLMGEELWSGWGVRTMSSGDAGFSPLSYHDGSIWPHDNSLIALGLARYDRWAEAHRIVRRMIEASRYFEHSLPEVFAGFARHETPFPIDYPTPARPQAWAAGASVLLLQVLLGLAPDLESRELVSVAPAGLARWAGELDLLGVPAFDARWDVFLRDGIVRVERA